MTMVASLALHVLLTGLTSARSGASGASLRRAVAVPASAANPQLCGVNNEWINPMGVFVGVNRDPEGRPGSWLPPNPGPWVNKTDPFDSAELTHLLTGLGLGSFRYPGGSIGNYWNWTSDLIVPNASDYYDVMREIQLGFQPHAFGAERFDAMLLRSGGAANVFTLDVSTAGPDPAVPSAVIKKLGLARASRFEIGNEVYDPRQGPQPGGYLTAQACAI